MVDRKQLFSKTVLLSVIVLLAFLIRLVPLNLISFNGHIYFSGTDAFYHMRRVSYTAENFPSVINFDSYLNYPLGYDIGWPPLFDQAIALLALVLGMGNPDTGTIELAGAVFPVLAGALTIVPLYVVSSIVFDKRTALVSAAALALLPIHLAVSMAGATDHHVAEVFLATCAYALYLLSLRSGRNANLSYEDIRSGTWGKEARRSLLYAIAAGFVFVLAIFTWLGSPIFMGIIGLFVLVQLTIDIKQHRSSDHVLISTITMFTAALVMAAPLIALVVRPGLELSGMFLSWFHVAYIASLLIGIVILGRIARIAASRDTAWYYYPVAVLILAGLGMLAVRIVSPEFYQNTVGGIQYLLVSSSPVLGTVAEAQPLFYSSGRFTLGPLWNSFFIFGLLALPGLVFGGVRLVRDKYTPEIVFFFVWSIVVILLTVSQRRFSYLLAVNVAIMSGFFLSTAWSMLAGEKQQVPVRSLSGKRSRSKSKAIKGVAVSGKHTSTGRKGSSTANGGGSSVATFLVALTCLMLAFVLFMHVFSLVTHPGTPSTDWKESLEWLNSNSPETSYFLEPDRKPEYGVMSWWDYGNWILYIAKRPVVANNFQTGVEDSAHFFASSNESESMSILDTNNVKYVITDYMMYATKSSAIFTIAGDEYMKGQNFTEFYNGEGMRNTTLAKLHILDGSMLGRLRLIHESPNSKIKLVPKGNEEEGTPIKSVKIFEYVEGARIYGSAAPNEPVYARVNVSSNQDRQFTYVNAVMPDDSGLYELRVPYSTKGSNDTEVTAGPYYIISQKNSSATAQVAVSEEDVVQGSGIQADLVA